MQAGRGAAAATTNPEKKEGRGAVAAVNPDGDGVVECRVLCAGGKICGGDGDGDDGEEDI